MIQIQLYGKPVPWTSPRIFGGKHFDPKGKDKELTRWQIKSQYRDIPIKGRVLLEFIFWMPMPKNTSGSKKIQMLNHVITPETKPDTTNLVKFYEDCLKGIVIYDDNAATDIVARKRYSENPGISIRVFPIFRNIQDKLIENSTEIKHNITHKITPPTKDEKCVPLFKKLTEIYS